MNISSEVLSRRQKYVDGQSISFPVPIGVTLLVECVIGYVWNDELAFKNVSCINDRWGPLPPQCISIFNQNF